MGKSSLPKCPEFLSFGLHMSRVPIALVAVLCSALGGIAVAEEIKSPPTMIDIEKGRQFWSFQAVKKPVLPTIKDTAWSSRFKYINSVKVPWS